MMQLKKMKLTALSLGLFATVSLNAQTEQERPPRGERPERPPVEEVFKNKDTNKDGVLSLEEFKVRKEREGDATKRQGKRKKRGEKMTKEEVFVKKDTNKDGVLSLEEFKVRSRKKKGKKA